MKMARLLTVSLLILTFLVSAFYVTDGRAQPVDITQFSVKVEPRVLRAGGNNSVSIFIRNLGGPVAEMDAVLTLPPQLIPLSDNRWRIGSLDSDQEVVLYADVYVPLLASGMALSGSLTINYRRHGEIGLPPKSELHAIGFLIEGPSKASQTFIKLSPVTIVAGLNNTVTLTIANKGEEIYDVDVTITIPPPLALLEGSRMTMETLSADGVVNMPLTIFAPSASAGIAVTGSVTIRYRPGRELKGGVQVVEVHTFGLAIRGRLTLIMFKVSVSPEVVEAGSTFTVIGTLLNKGNVPARYVNVSLSSDGPFSFTSDSVSFLGDVLPHADSFFSLMASVRDDAPEGVYKVKILVTYEDDIHVERSVERWVEVKVVRPLMVVAPRPQGPIETLLSYISTPTASLAMFFIIVALTLALAIQRAVMVRRMRRLQLMR